MKILLVMIVGLMLSLSVAAQEKYIGTKVISTSILGSDYFGGCYATLTNIAEFQVLNCQAIVDAGGTAVAGLVSFSCSGEKHPKDKAYRMLDSVQMALALDKTVGIMVSDDETDKIDGACLAKLVDVYKN